MHITGVLYIVYGLTLTYKVCLLGKFSTKHTIHSLWLTLIYTICLLGKSSTKHTQASKCLTQVLSKFRRVHETKSTGTNLEERGEETAVVDKKT